MQEVQHLSRAIRLLEVWEVTLVAQLVSQVIAVAFSASSLASEESPDLDWSCTAPAQMSMGHLPMAQRT